MLFQRASAAKIWILVHQLLQSHVGSALVVTSPPTANQWQAPALNIADRSPVLLQTSARVERNDATARSGPGARSLAQEAFVREQIRQLTMENASFLGASTLASMQETIFNIGVGLGMEKVLTKEQMQLALGTMTDIASKPLMVADLGSRALAAKAQIAGSAVEKAQKNCWERLKQGDVVGAMQAAAAAIAHAQEENVALDNMMSSAAAHSLGILLVLLLIGGCWAIELVLTRRYDQREQETNLKAAASKGEPVIAALGFARYLFSWWVILDNFYQRGTGRQSSASATASTIFARWGALAWPWFFLVSGFVTSYSKLLSSKVESHDWFSCMVRRVMTWYPLYVLVLTWNAIRYWSILAEDWACYMAGMLLLNGLIWAENVYPYVLGDQWLCFLMVYLTVWSPMYEVLYTSTNSVLWTVFTIACLVAIPSAIMEWYFFEDMPLWVLIQYWPSFVFGQALAVWFVRNCMKQKDVGEAELVYVLRPVHEIPLAVRFGPTISFLVFGISSFCFSLYDRLVLIRKPIAPLILKGGFLPLIAMQVVGLAVEVDPIAKLFARAPFRWAEKIALTNFFCQVPIHNLILDWTGWDGITWTFSFTLLLCSILAHSFLEQPWRKFLGAREK